ncbi:hypothetical protein OPT61_g5660 [Boeremia exigua]|uniref:Uncharacterized protein n=1 Tax=Boeremia exigua TaxID=749465 RepID=A0ACC2I9H4_9PLEO|nr:hypothetical protein OPT61_g5660 [Boeremia exigua]
MATVCPGSKLGAMSAGRDSEYFATHEPRSETTYDAAPNPSWSLARPTLSSNQTERSGTQASTPRPTSIFNSNIELDAINPDNDARAGGTEFSLPPVDTGKDAWLFLLSAFVMECLVWGFPFAFGIFQEYYSSHPPFQGERNIAIIGTCAMGIMYLSSPLIFGFMAWYPRMKRLCIMIGLLTMCASLGLSSLSTTVPHLIASQGAAYAIGGALCYSPTISFMDEWFVKRKGLAFGMMWAGTGLGGVVIPLLLQFLLNKYGFRTTLRIWAVVLFASTAPLYRFLKPRLPVSQTTNRRAFDLSFLTKKSFLLLQLGNILEGFGYFVPSIYLPTYAKSLGASNNVVYYRLDALHLSAMGLLDASLPAPGILRHVWAICGKLLDNLPRRYEGGQ